MPRKRKALMPEAPLAPVPSEMLDQFVRQGPISPEELDAAVRRFKKAIIERALGGELTDHLGYPAGGTKPDASTNHRNGTGGKTVITDDGPLTIDAARSGRYLRAAAHRETRAPLHFRAQLRKIIKTRGHFPTDEAATKLIWLALRNITAKMGARPAALETRDTPVCDPLRRSVSDPTDVKCQPRMDAAGAVDAENAPTAPWKTAQRAVSHSAHTNHPFVRREESRSRLTHRIPDTPRLPSLPSLPPALLSSEKVPS